MSTKLRESRSTIVALMLAHCAGMIDLIALPVWVGTLVAYYSFDPQQAGSLPTMFLVGASIASIAIARQLHRLSLRKTAIMGFGAAAIVLFLCAATTDYRLLLALHLVGGMCVGSALSVTHATIGHSSNPHRLFGLAGLAIGILGILFLGSAPGVIASVGGKALFMLLSGLMGIAALVSLMFFPDQRTITASVTTGGASFSRPVWFLIVGVSLLCMTQAMTLSFFERIGVERGFEREMITLALVAYGVVAIFPAPIAALLERRLAATTVVCIGPLFQGLFALLATHTSNYWIYAASGAMMGFVVIFIHTFAFGLLARIDGTGRAVAGTPAMLMVGGAFAPILGGTLAKFFDFAAIGLAACALVALQVLLFNTARRSVVRDAVPAPVASV